MVSCFHNTTNAAQCWWSHNDVQDITLNYDIWLVNGNPFTKHVNPFEHQFSFQMHDVFEIYLVFFILYTCLVPIQLYALSQQKHTLPLILTTCMVMEYVGVIFNFVHIFKFAFDGEGVDLLHIVGNFIDQIAQCLFMLLLLLIVKGWTITKMDLRSKGVLFTVWGSYTVANLALFIWNQVSQSLKVHIILQGSHPTWKTLETCNFAIYITRPGKCLEFAQKVGNTWNFNSKPRKKMKIYKFGVSRFIFQDVIY